MNSKYSINSTVHALKHEAEITMTVELIWTYPELSRYSYSVQEGIMCNYLDNKFLFIKLYYCVMQLPAP